MSRLANTAQTSRRVPPSFYELDFVRSYAREDEDGNLWRVEVRRHPQSGQCVQVQTPMPVDRAQARR